MTSHMSTAEPEGYTVPRWGPYPSQTLEQARTRRFCVIQYALVWIYTGRFLRYPNPEGHLLLGDDLINIMTYPPDNNDNENDQARDDILYSHGDPSFSARNLSLKFEDLLVVSHGAIINLTCAGKVVPSTLDAEDDIETAGGVKHRGDMLELFENSAQWNKLYMKVE